MKKSLNSAIKGRPELVDLVLVCLFSEEHLLIEDVPGLGNTTLARALAKSIGGSWNRIQFTPDIFPATLSCPPELGPSPVRQVTPTEWGWEDGYETDQTYA